MNAQGAYIFLYRYWAVGYVIYGLMLCCMLMSAFLIERYSATIVLNTTQVRMRLIEQKKECSVLCQTQQNFEYLLKDYTAQKECLNNISLKETCALLFAEHSHYALELVSYDYRLIADSYSASAYLKGDYYAIMSFYKAIYTQFPFLRCLIASIKRTESNMVEAQLIVSTYKEPACV